MSTEETKALIEEALKFARGDWQRTMIETGYDRIRGVGVYYISRYRESIWALYMRLREAGFRVAIHQPEPCIFCLVVGDPWVNWVEALQSLRDEIIAIREKVRAVVDKNPRLLKELSRHRILQSLKNLQGETSAAIWRIAIYYSDYLDCVFGKGNAQEYLEKSKEVFEQAKRQWHEFWDKTKTTLGIILL